MKSFSVIELWNFFKKNVKYYHRQRKWKDYQNYISLTEQMIQNRYLKKIDWCWICQNDRNHCKQQLSNHDLPKDRLSNEIFLVWRLTQLNNKRND